ncbi:hypothetical protein M9458_051586, partial [Cirrhinus mrigala]
MANTHRAPKQWCLTKVETVNSFENWRQNLVYTLSLDTEFAPFLVDGECWEKKTRASPFRGFTDDDADVPTAQWHTHQQKVSMLELMLGQITNYCPVISRNTVVKNSTCIDQIWQTIRLHYGFRSTGAHFIDFAAIKLESNEGPEDLYQRLMAFVEDNLLRRDSGITHGGEAILEDEELSPRIENFIVLTWLHLIHSDLPKLVKQRYGTELRSLTLASIKPEISQALCSLLDELQSSEDARAMRSAVSNPPRQKLASLGRSRKSCPLCKEAHRPDNHFFSKCPFLPLPDKAFIARARQVADSPCLSDGESEDDSENISCNPKAVQRVHIMQSPCLEAFHGHVPVRLTIDSGATGNMIRAACATKLGLRVSSSTQSAHQADGSSPLKVVGETHTHFQRDGHMLFFDGLVVENLDSDILAGIPFMECNDISIRPAKHQVCVGSDIYEYGTNRTCGDRHAIRRAHVLRATSSHTVWPGDFVELELPAELAEVNEELAVEPHEDCTHWFAPSLFVGVSGKIRIPNLTDAPQGIRKHDHVCRVRMTYIPEPHTEQVQLEVSQAAARKPFHREFDEVFSPQFRGYNGAAGPFQARVNMGPVQPPQRKGRVPQYSRGQLQELQAQFDALESLGVFRKPEDIDVDVEYVNPSFLVKKSNGGFRLVTAFADVGRYSKPQPSLMPNVDATLRLIAQWRYIIATDLTKAFYQIPLSKSSMKYCGVVTPFKGVCVYARCAMGMPGSETALEELTCRILGDLLEQGRVAKIVDDLYCGADTLEDLLAVWKQVLVALQVCNLCLYPSKTIVAPIQTNILGWVWSQGTIRASLHRIATLASCPPPPTVSGLRSFIGAYKVLARVLKGCVSILAPFDNMVAGGESTAAIVWSDELLQCFQRAQQALSTSCAVTIPRPDDQLWIVTDGALRDPGLGATMYVTRGEKLLVAGHFSAKLRKNQIDWLPCEIEALAIAAALKHFGPYIIQSSQKACVLTDSKPCVQAFEKLCRGEFSASPRVTTFLSAASRFQVSVRHVAGAAILPSDYASRHAAQCDSPVCQVCSFVRESLVSVVCRTDIYVADILRGAQKVPFANRATWVSIQAECPDLRRVRAHLRQGTRPSKRVTNVKDVKRYMNTVTLANDGLLVVRRNTPLSNIAECIVVPRSVLHGLLMSLHIRLDHPSAHKSRLVVGRYFYALDLDSAIQLTSKGCHQCAALARSPVFAVEQSSCNPPETVGSTFAADVLKREHQLILVVHECVTSFTAALLIDDKRKESLRDGIVRLCIGLRPLDGPFAIVRTDPAPGFSALAKDTVLTQYRLAIEVGNAKNVYVTIAVARLNSRIRSRGMSAREMLLQRDQFSLEQLLVHDQELIALQHAQRLANHPHSVKAEAPLSRHAPVPDICPGDLVYLYSDRNKSQARSRYLVLSLDGTWCNIRKFTGSQLRHASYRVRLTDCYKVDSFPSVAGPCDNAVASESEEECEMPFVAPPSEPDIPLAIATPASPPRADCSRRPGDRTVSPCQVPCRELASLSAVPVQAPRRSGRLCRLPE